MSEQLQVKVATLPTSVASEDGESLESVFERIGKENEQKYGKAIGIYAKTDFDLCFGYKDDIQAIYMTQKMLCDIAAEGVDDINTEMDIHGLSATTQVGFRNWLTRWMTHWAEWDLEGADPEYLLDIERVRKTISDTQHNIGVYMDMLDKHGIFGTHGKALIVQNIDAIVERIGIIVNKVEEVINA